MPQPQIVTVSEKPVVLKWVSDEIVKDSSNTISSTTCAPCDQCDPNILDTEEKSEASMSDEQDIVEKNAEKDPEPMGSHRAHRSQLADNNPTEDSSMPIVSVEDFFSSYLPLPDHSLEQSPCCPIIGSKSEGNYIMYHCKIHPKESLESIEHHCRFAEPEHHKAEIISRMKPHI